METVNGYKELKDKWLYCKMKAGDMRGLKSSRFEMAARLGIAAYEVAFNSIAPKEGKVEIQADVVINDVDYGAAYTYKDLCEILKGESGIIEIILTKVQWNKIGTDAVRTTICYIEFKP